MNEEHILEMNYKHTTMENKTDILNQQMRGPFLG